MHVYEFSSNQFSHVFCHYFTIQFALFRTLHSIEIIFIGLKEAVHCSVISSIRKHT